MSKISSNNFAIGTQCIYSQRVQNVTLGDLKRPVGAPWDFQPSSDELLSGCRGPKKREGAALVVSTQHVCSRCRHTTSTGTGCSSTRQPCF